MLLPLPPCVQKSRKMASEKEGITTRDGFPPNENTQNYTLRKRTRTRQTERERITESAERHCSCYWEFMLRKNLLPAKLCFNSPLAMKWSLYIAHQSTAKLTENGEEEEEEEQKFTTTTSERESERGVQERRRCSRATKLTPYDSCASWLLRLRHQFEL